MTDFFTRGGFTGTIKTSGTTLAIPGVNTTRVGEVMFAAIFFDNLSSTTPVLNSLTKPASETNSWTITNVNASVATAGGGIKVAYAWLKTTVAWPATTVTATLSASVTAKVGFIQVVGWGPDVGDSSSVPAVITPGAPIDGKNLFISGKAGPPNTWMPIGVTGPGSHGYWPANSFVFVAHALEDTTYPVVSLPPAGGGTWVSNGTNNTVGTSGGSTVTNLSAKAFFKTTTTDGAEFQVNYDAPVSDVAAVMFVLSPETGTPPPVTIEFEGWGIQL